MLIGLVRDSVMQCFCHTCRAPLPAAAGIVAKNIMMQKSSASRTKQPQTSKKVKFITTEVRCQEKSKGGIKYEVILAEPTLTNQLPKNLTNSNQKIPAPLSVEEIQEKLKAAEERRLNLEAKKIADWSAKVTKIQEASRKKDELNNEFIIATKETLMTKMEQSEEKREAIIMDLKEKLKLHAEEIKRNKETLQYQKLEEKNALNDKLKTAAILRDENIKRILERLREHEKRAAIVRQNKAMLANQQQQQLNCEMIEASG